jgi:sugar/nucleoside kinase (ribokinase family)
MPRPLNLLAIGDSAKDVFLNIHEASLSCSLNKEACLLCLNYADKIPVTSVTAVRAAGNAANAAVGIARLGHRSGLVTILGDDHDGHELQAALREEGVDHRYVTFDKKHGTNYSTVLSYQGERTILTYSQPRTYVFPKNVPEADWIYYTTLGDHHLAYEKKLLEFLRMYPETHLLFNPGTSQLRRGMPSLLPIIRRSDILILNKEEAERLLEDGVRPVPALLMRLQKDGPRAVVITDGKKGSWSYDGEEMWQLPIFTSKSVEATGAGDAYATGFVDACMNGKPIKEAMRWGTANAGSVVQHIGPQKGLLTMPGMKKMLKRYAKIRAQKVNPLK